MNRRRWHRWLLLAGLISLIAFRAGAQSNAIPPFKMLLTNGRMFSAADLPKKKPVILIYFAPDCEHCEQLMGALFKKMDAFQRAEIVMVTFKSLPEVARFEEAYQTARYPNITVGTEGSTFYLRTYYHLQNTPFTALYDQQQSLVYAYRKQTLVDDLITRLKQITNK
jgi:thiol-disulfide isomerase/thioredoxin